MTDDDSDRIERLERLVAQQQQVIDELLARQDSPRTGSRAATAAPDALSRRAVLRRALVAGGAVVAGSAALAVAEAAPAAAAPSSPSLVAAGQTTTDATTVVYGSAAGSAYPQGILAITDTAFNAVDPSFTFPGALNGYGGPDLQVGVAGYGDFTGIIAGSKSGTALVAQGSTGIHAESTSGSAISAVAGPASANACISAFGKGTGSAVEAQVTGAAPSLYAKSGTGAAVRADGPVVVNGTTSFNGPVIFSRSGTAVVAGTRTKPRRSVVVTHVGLSAHSRVLATIQGDAGSVALSGVVVNATKHTLTINLTAAVRRSVAVTWLVLG
jgi:hypothetical protein